MAKYHQKSKSEDKFLKDFSRADNWGVVFISLGVALLTLGGLFAARHFWADVPTDKAFNISLLVSTAVGFIIYARHRIEGSFLASFTNLVIFWYFIETMPSVWFYALLFVPVYVAVSLLLFQILRIRNGFLVLLLLAPLVILAHLV